MLSGFTLLFEALVLTFVHDTAFAAVVCLSDEVYHPVMACSQHYVDLTLGQADFSGVICLTIDEASGVGGTIYMMQATNAVSE